MDEAGESVVCEFHKCGRTYWDGLLYTVVGMGVLLGLRPVAAQDYTVNLDWIYYKDNSGREISYDFSDATLDEHSVVTIPASAVIARPPSEASTEFRWDPGLELQEVALNGDMYAISVPQVELTPREIPIATIAVDGSPSDWSSVGMYIDDAVGETWWTGMTETDVDYLKLAYSPDGTRFNILMKTHGGVSGNIWYRLFLDRDLDGYVDEPNDFQIDFQYNGGSWDVVSQGWISEEQWYPVDEGGIVVVSGDFIEASVTTESFGLSGDFNVYGRTMLGTSPYTIHDTFATPFLGRCSGFASMSAYYASAPAPLEWQFAARLVGFENASTVQHGYGVSVGSGSGDPDDLEPDISAWWFTGNFAGTQYNKALLIGAEVRNDLDGTDAYDWEWTLPEGGGVVIDGLDPETTVLDLRVDVANSGQTVSFYYRIDSDDAANWQLAITHTLPAGVGALYGFEDTRPIVGLETDYFPAEAARPLHDWNDDGIVSIIGDVPPFVQCVYFQNCPSGIDLIAVGDCNDDGLLSIIGDVPCFVDCVYFENCPD